MENGTTKCWWKRLPLPGLGCVLNRRWKSPICGTYKEANKEITKKARDEKERSQSLYGCWVKLAVGVLHHTVCPYHIGVGYNFV
jgi:hypothetical protein